MYAAVVHVCERMRVQHDNNWEWEETKNEGCQASTSRCVRACVSACARTCKAWHACAWRHTGNVADVFERLVVKIGGEVNAQERDLLIVLVHFYLQICVFV